MIITKCAKRLMATVMTTALVLTGLVVAPKEVSAAEGDPTVEVLGATLRLDGKSGYQSMRVGIKVTNASKANACGIKFAIGSKEYTVSTDSEEYRNIYAYDEANDMITYTAVIKDIPKDAFTTDINVQGKTKAINTEVEITSGDAITKSIDSVVKELQKLDSSVKLNDNGDLVRTVDDSDVPVSADDSIFDFPSSKELTTANLDLSTYDAKGNTVTKNEDGSLTVNFTNNYCGANIAIPSNLSNLKSVELSVVSSKNGEELSGGNQILFFDTEGKEISARYGKGIISFTVPENKTLGSIWINAQEASADVPQIMTISYIKLSKILSLDLNNFIPIGAESSKLNDDGTLSIKYSGNNYTGSYIDIPSEYQDFKYFELKITSPNSKDAQSGTQVTALDTDGKKIATNYIGNWNAEGVTSFNIPEDKKVGKIIVNAQLSSAEDPVNQTIYYIKARV